MSSTVKAVAGLATLKSQSPEYRQKLIAQIAVILLPLVGIEMTETDLLAAIGGIEAVYLAIRGLFGRSS